MLNKILTVIVIATVIAAVFFSGGFDVAEQASAQSYHTGGYTAVGPLNPVFSLYEDIDTTMAIVDLVDDEIDIVNGIDIMGVSSIVDTFMVDLIFKHWYPAKTMTWECYSTTTPPAGYHFPFDADSIRFYWPDDYTFDAAITISHTEYGQ